MLYILTTYILHTNQANMRMRGWGLKSIQVGKMSGFFEGGNGGTRREMRKHNIATQENKLKYMLYIRKGGPKNKRLERGGLFPRGRGQLAAL